MTTPQTPSGPVASAPPTFSTNVENKSHNKASQPLTGGKTIPSNQSYPPVAPPKPTVSETPATIAEEDESEDSEEDSEEEADESEEEGSTNSKEDNAPQGGPIEQERITQVDNPEGSIPSTPAQLGLPDTNPEVTRPRADTSPPQADPVEISNPFELLADLDADRLEDRDPDLQKELEETSPQQSHHSTPRDNQSIASPPPEESTLLQHLPSHLPHEEILFEIIDTHTGPRSRHLRGSSETRFPVVPTSPQEEMSTPNPPESTALTLYQPQDFDVIMTEEEPRLTMSQVRVEDPPDWLVQLHNKMGETYQTLYDFAHSVDASHRQHITDIRGHYQQMQNTYNFIVQMITHNVDASNDQIAQFKHQVEDASSAFSKKV